MSLQATVVNSSLTDAHVDEGSKISVQGIDDKDQDLEKNIRYPEKPTDNTESSSKWSPLIWILVGLAIASAIAFAIALGVTSMRWNKSNDKEVPTACQFLGIKVGTLMGAIGSTSNCAPDGQCYNMTTEQMKNYIGTPRFVHLEPNYFSCIDGRHDNEIIATPAGDMGVFLSSAAVFISGSSAPNDFSLSRMESLLRSFILKFRSRKNQFYYHTDTHAVEHVIETLHAEGIHGQGYNLEDMTKPDFKPHDAAREPLLKALSDLKVGAGCGHVKYMGLYPEKYGIKSGDLVVNTVRAIWQLRWGELRDYIRIDELDHDHHEQAVLSITDIVGCEGMSPIVTQRAPDAEDSTFYTQQIFVNHEAAVKPFRREVAEWWLTQPGASKTTTASQFYSQINDLATAQLLESAGRLAKHRPLFNATVTGKLWTPPHER